MLGYRHFYAVYDGHGGPNLSRFLASNLIPHVAAGLDKSTNNTNAASAIKRAFLLADDTISSFPLLALDQLRSASEPAEKNVVKELQTRWLLSNQGSCALLAICDEARDVLHVAVTGDSRAVMGTWEPDSPSGPIWRTQVLTEDQTSANPKEARRYAIGPHIVLRLTGSVYSRSILPAKPPRW